jgi:hypothetical protein
MFQNNGQRTTQYETAEFFSNVGKTCGPISEQEEGRSFQYDFCHSTYPTQKIYHFYTMFTCLTGGSEYNIAGIVSTISQCNFCLSKSLVNNN